MFKILTLIVATLTSLETSAFILLTKNYRLSKPEDTVFKISAEGCPGNLGLLKEAMERAVEIWNDVPESRLRLKVGGRSATALTSNTIPSGEVIIGCATTPPGTGGATVPDEARGSAKITINSSLYNSGNGSWGNILTTVTHELGHAIGLNHSNDRASVMTYESNGWRSVGPSYLSQDDVDGVTYLYPNEKELGGLMGSCSSFAAGGGEKVSFVSEFILSFMSILGIFAFVRLLRGKKS